MATKKKIEYGMIAAKIGPVDSESTVSKERFFALLEERYPSADGWEVYSTESILVNTNFQGSSNELPFVTYHLKKVNG
jgi:hypothetical protein